MTKVVAFNGSPRKDGNTSILIGHIFDELEKEGIETELVQIGVEAFRGCMACMKCQEKKDGHCVFNDDIVNSCIDKMVEADGIILGSPVYLADVTAGMKGLIERAAFVSAANGRTLFQHKAGAVVVAVRRAGAMRTLDTMLHFLLATGMIVSDFGVIGVGLNPGDVDKDPEGIASAERAGKNMAWLLKTMKKGTC
ncbi:flavodoxin family protein [Methanosphaerula palustris]|uniref:NADPH-dependent FMN reductase n=1 Tax=Methanosphaerula palustris (strain ATCC BAA-1556 / DSM 19958 / E1-9c) TaxID=521011 RepID=B8GIK9_METPE|nr:flavodoxin family protein [Methanosphaerula palustris]ACL16822.1 NADPH-dependent FMN reductase [Methanosphaerula palustris E1-9c]